MGIYVALMLTVFKLIPVTLTAAGIAGFLLSVGMAVDANILIFERMKEEMKKGKELGDAMHDGFTRAWTSIRDSNISSLISASILFWFGTSVVKGFALTLGLGVLLSLFTAITVSRSFLYALGASGKSKLVHFLFGGGFTK
jgi:protein-export membrane protein SecD